MDIKMYVPCLFGLEGLAADELKRLDMREVRAENGHVCFTGDKGDIARANINLRTGERVLIDVGDAPAKTYDELFEAVRAMPWDRYIPMDGAFPVKGHSLNSALHSIPDCQRIVKKAIVERLKAKYKLQWLPETGPRYQVQFALMNDRVTMLIDTSGQGLHKRGYRPIGNAAPLRETLAAAMVKLARYRGRELVCDPFCGSGTIPIEAALAALNRAPGLNRSFDAQKWAWLRPEIWRDAVQEARDREFHGSYRIWGGDVDPACIDIARANAKRAGVADHITFAVADAMDFRSQESGGIILSNPPYGERVMERAEAEQIYAGFGRAVRSLDQWKLYILSSHTEFERTFGRTAVKKRKLYNGMIKCDLFMYF